MLLYAPTCPYMPLHAPICPYTTPNTPYMPLYHSQYPLCTPVALPIPPIAHSTPLAYINTILTPHNPRKHTPTQLSLRQFPSTSTPPPLPPGDLLPHLPNGTMIYGYVTPDSLSPDAKKDGSEGMKKKVSPCVAYP